MVYLEEKVDIAIGQIVTVVLVLLVDRIPVVWVICSHPTRTRTSRAKVDYLQIRLTRLMMESDYASRATILYFRNF